MASRKIEVELLGDSRSLERALGKAGSAGSKMGKVFRTTAKVVAGAGLAIGAALGITAKIGFDEMQQGARVAAKTNAVIKSTGGVANVTAKQLDRLSTSLMKKTGVDDEVIKSGGNMLLTFKQIRNEAGKGNDIFDQATKATLDLSVAMGKDMPDAAIMVGKALNDPIRGLTAMRRVGIQFTEAQEKQIKKMVESGDVMGAQKKILQELNSQFGGAAEAVGETLPGKLDILRERFSNFAGDLVSRAIPALMEAADVASDFLGFLGDIGDAKSPRVALSIAFAGVKKTVGGLVDSIRAVVFGETTRKPLKLDSGKIIEWETTKQEGLFKSIKDGLRNVDWASVGRQIGEGISKRVRITADFIATALTAMNQFIDANLDKFAELGAKMMLAVIGKLLDAGFWVRNWQLVLGVAVAVFPLGRLVKLGASAAAAVLRLFGKLLPAGFRGIGGRAVDAILGQLGRLPGSVQRIIVAVVSAAVAGLGRLVGFLRGQVAGVLARVPGWLKAAFRLSVFMAFVSGVQAGWAKVRAATATAVDAVRNQVGRISGPLSTVVGWLRTINDWLLRLTRAPWTIVLKIPRPSLPDIPGIPGFASGGVVPGAVGAPMLAVVHGGETVTPAGRSSSRGGGSSQPVQVNLVLERRVLASVLLDMDHEKRRRNGGRGLLPG